MRVGQSDRPSRCISHHKRGEQKTLMDGNWIINVVMENLRIDPQGLHRRHATETRSEWPMVSPEPATSGDICIDFGFDIDSLSMEV